jgi:hypothetical protein
MHHLPLRTLEKHSKRHSLKRRIRHLATGNVPISVGLPSKVRFLAFFIYLISIFEITRLRGPSSSSFHVVLCVTGNSCWRHSTLYVMVFRLLMNKLVEGYTPGCILFSQRGVEMVPLMHRHSPATWFLSPRLQAVRPKAQLGGMNKNTQKSLLADLPLIP